MNNKNQFKIKDLGVSEDTCERIYEYLRPLVGEQDWLNEQPKEKIMFDKYSLVDIQNQINYIQAEINNGQDTEAFRKNLKDLKEIREEKLKTMDWDSQEDRDVWNAAQLDWYLEGAENQEEDIDVSEKCPDCGHWHDDCNNGTSLCNRCLFPYPKRY